VNLLDARRRVPRIPVDGLCGVVSDDDDLRHASMSELSAMGLRLEHVYDPKIARRRVQLEIELPGVDEIIWATATATHASVTPMRRGADGQLRFWCRTGLRIADASRRERQLLRDYVVDCLIRSRRVADRRDLRSDRREQRTS
jgi:hypothetical protein